MNNQIFTTIQLTALMGYCMQKFGTINVPVHELIARANIDAINGDTTFAKCFNLAIDVAVDNVEID